MSQNRFRTSEIGSLSPVEADAKRMLAAGAQFVAVGADVGPLARGAENLLAKFKP